MARYTLSNFLSNMDSLTEKIETEEKKRDIGLIIGSLQRPFTEILQAVCEKQQKDVDELYKSLGWK